MVPGGGAASGSGLNAVALRRQNSRPSTSAGTPPPLAMQWGEAARRCGAHLDVADERLLRAGDGVRGGPSSGEGEGGTLATRFVFQMKAFEEAVKHLREQLDNDRFGPAVADRLRALPQAEADLSDARAGLLRLAASAAEAADGALRAALRADDADSRAPTVLGGGLSPQRSPATEAVRVLAVPPPSSPRSPTGGGASPKKSPPRVGVQVKGGGVAGGKKLGLSASVGTPGGGVKFSPAKSKLSGGLRPTTAEGGSKIRAKGEGEKSKAAAGGAAASGAHATGGGDGFSAAREEVQRLWEGEVEAVEAAFLAATNALSVFEEHVSSLQLAGEVVEPIEAAAAFDATPPSNLHLFGDNRCGQLGLGAGSHKLSEVTGLSGAVKAVSCGWEHTACISSDGAVYTWGCDDWAADSKNSHKASLRFSPARVHFPPCGAIVAVSCGWQHTAALSAAGVVFTWGWNGHGQLGSGGTAVAAAPRAVEGLLGRVVAAVACGGFHTLAATTSGRLFAWGLGRDGQLGTGLRSSHVGPIAVEVEDPIVAIAAGHAHSAAVSKSGVCYTFGCGRDGRLGHGSQSEEYRPRAVKSLARVVVSAVTCGYAHTAALGREGSIWTCGKGQYGALGHGERTDGRTFRQVLAMGGVVAARVSCGGFHTAAVTVGGECFVWGDGSHHQLPVDAIDAFKPAAVRKFGKRAVTGVASGYRHTALCVT